MADRTSPGEDPVDPEVERYGLVWPGRCDALRLLRAPCRATLEPAPEESVAWDTTGHLFLEGDNLEALKLLRASHLGRVKTIYIDPPYNTDLDLVYPDRRGGPRDVRRRRTGRRDPDGSLADGRAHAPWLSLMLPRLGLARTLLRDDGVILVSIDDREVHHLRLLMDEWFGEERFVGTIKRRASRKTAFLRKGISDVCDYVLVYSRGPLPAALSVETVTDGERPVLNRGNAASVRVVPSGRPARCPDGTYPPGERAVRSLEFRLLDPLTVRGGRTEGETRVEGPFRINQDVLARTVFVTRHVGLRRTLLPGEREAPKTLGDLLDRPDCRNEAGSEEIRALFGAPVFDHPKPVGLIKHLLRAVAGPNPDPGAIVLDFFAGSATTAQAVLELNREDGGDRRFVLVQSPEPTPERSAARRAGFATIADIGKERIRRVVARMADAQTTLRPPRNDGAPEDLGFRVYRIE